MSPVVINQPLAITEKHYHSSIMNDNYLVLSISLCVLSLLFGCFWTLFFSIPAIIHSVKVSLNCRICLYFVLVNTIIIMQARKAFKRTEYREMIENEKIAFGFNIGVIVCWIISFTIVVGVTYRELCGPTGINCNTSPYHPDD